jgi:hypothetical protein
MVGPRGVVAQKGRVKGVAGALVGYVCYPDRVDGRGGHEVGEEGFVAFLGNDERGYLQDSERTKDLGKAISVRGYDGHGFLGGLVRVARAVFFDREAEHCIIMLCAVGKLAHV